MQPIPDSELKSCTSSGFSAWPKAANEMTSKHDMVVINFVLIGLMNLNYRHTGEQLVASPAPQARCAGVCHVFISEAQDF